MGRLQPEVVVATSGAGATSPVARDFGGAERGLPWRGPWGAGGELTGERGARQRGASLRAGAGRWRGAFVVTTKKKRHGEEKNKLFSV